MRFDPFTAIPDFDPSTAVPDGWEVESEEPIGNGWEVESEEPLAPAPRRGGTATELRRAAGTVPPSAAKPQAEPAGGKADPLPANVSRADSPFANRDEAINDAVDRIELGAPADQVFAAFEKGGIRRDEIIARGRQLGGKAFQDRSDMTPARPGALPLAGEVKAVEPTTMEGVANFGRRAKERAGQIATGALATAGVIPADSAAASLAASQKRLEAAAPGSEIQRGLEAFGQVKTFGEAFRAIAEHPAATAVTVAESAVLFLPVLAAATFAGLPAAGTAAVVGGTSAAMEFGSSLTEVLGDKGIDPRDVEAVGRALRDPAFMAEVRERGAIRGLTIGAIDALTAGMAGRFIDPVLQAAKAGRVARGEAAKMAAGAAAKELSVQVAGGAGGEALAQAFTGESKPFDVVVEGLAEGLTAPMEAASNIRGARRAATESTPDAQLARAFGLDVADRYFEPGAIDGYARRAGDARFYDPTFVDPTRTARPGAASPVANDAPAAAPVVRAEDMPTEVLTPEQVAALASQLRAAQAAATINPYEDIDPVSSETAAGRQKVAQAAAPEAGDLPSIARGSLLAEARDALASRRVAADDDQQRPRQVEVPKPVDDAVPKVPPLVDSAGPSSAPPQAADPLVIQPARQKPDVATAAPRPAEVDQARGAERPVGRGQAAGGASVPTFQTADQALVWSVENRRTDLEPVKIGRRWGLRPRATAAAAPNAAVPAGATAPTLQPTAPALGAEARAAGDGAVATQHFDPGQQPEPATKAVVRASITTAATNLGRKPSELKADLLQKIDDAIASAPSAVELDAQLELGQARQVNGKAQMDGSRWFSADRTGQRLLVVARQFEDRAWTVSVIRVDADGRRRAERIGTAEGSPGMAREQVMSLMRRLQPDGALGDVDLIEIDVPGDGTFRVANTKERLTEFRRKVETSPGFKDRQPTPKAEGPTGTQRGSASTKAAIEAMLDEGDAQAALDYAQLKGIDIRAIGLSPARLAKLNGLTPTEPDDAADAGGQQARRAGAAPAPSPLAAAPEPPVAPATRNPAPASDFDVRPHELTQAQFLATVTFERGGNSSNPWTATWRGVQLEAAPEVIDHPDLGKTLSMGARLFPTRKAAVAVAKAAHRRAVARALQRGDPVPDAVLAPYADLSRPESAPARAAADEYAEPQDNASVSADVERQLARFAADDYGALEGREVAIPVQITNTGETRQLEVDAASYLRTQDRRLRDIADGRLPEAPGAERALARYLAAGLGDDAARAQALRDTEAVVRRIKAAILAALREQHSDLFDRIDDAGEKIGGARKDRWAERGMNVDDLDTMSEAEGAQLVSKAAVWKPDYAAMVEAGASRDAAAMVKVIYDQLAAKPKANTPEGRRDYVRAMQAVRQVYGQVKTADEVKAAVYRVRELLGVTGTSLGPELQAARRVLFSVYKGRSDPFSLGYNEIARATRLVADGFPAPLEPWTRRLVVRSIGGAGITPRGVELYLAEAGKLGTPLTDGQLRAGAWRVTDKAGKVQAYAATKADAEAAAKAIYERQRATPDTMAEPERPHLDKLVRTGLPPVIDRDVKAEDFLAEFGFRGIEWGNWAAQDERQKIANLAFDGLADLARVLNVPTKALSLNGTLGMAFGARGGGRFAAHYEPGKLVINMTKLRGAGSLAHEFAHAFDHYLGELDRDDAYKTLPRGASGWYSEERYDGQAQRRMVQGADGRWTPTQQRRLGNLRPELAERIDAVMRALFTGQQSKADMLKEFDANIARAVSNAAKTADDPNLKAMYERQAENLRQARQEIEADPEGTTYPKGRSQFAAEAQKLSGKSSRGYWLRPTEMFARAFEAYVFDRLVAMGARSEYLVHGVEAERYAGGGYRGNPYPTGEERAAINKAFDALVAELKTREGEDGRMVLFQRKPDDMAERAALRALSQSDELFALPKPEGVTVAEIAAEIDPTIVVKERSVPGRQAFDLTMRDGSVARLMSRKPTPFGPTLYGFDQAEGEIVNAFEGRPGENPQDVDPETEDVWIDVSLLRPGANGTAVYAIAAAYAHNTGRIFIGDPAGLSDEAMRRRAEHMLSSALKYGTTAHLAPHPRQTVGAKSIGVPPLKWVYGDDLGNIRRLIELNVAALDHAMPAARKLDFDVATGSFLDADRGRGSVPRRVVDAAGDRAATSGASAAALAGRRTLARGAVLRALLREEGRSIEGDGRRDGLLARLARLATESLGTTRGIFYARRAGGDQGLTPDGVRAVVREITSSWAAAPDLVVIASMAEAPPAAQRENERQMAAGAIGVPAVFWLDGQVYLVASELQSVQEVVTSILHESIGHHGLRGHFGDRLGTVLEDVARLRERDVRAKASEYGLDFDDEAQRLRAAEEVLAELAQTDPKSSLVQRALAAIRSWLREHVPMLADLGLSDGELIERFIVPARRWVVEGSPAGRLQREANPAFARKGEVDGFRKWLEQSADKPLPVVTNTEPKGQPAAADAGELPGAPGFEAWFAGSKVVDEQGQPRRVWGRINPSGRFAQLPLGPFGAGRYFVAEPGGQAPGAGQLKPAYVALKNPYVYDGARVAMPEGWTEPKGLSPAVNERLRRELRSPAAGLIKAVMPPTSADQMLARIFHGRTDLGDTLTKRLKELGHDGLIVRFADPNDGPETIVAFDAGQVREAAAAYAEPASLVDSRAFDAWFKDSVFVDEQGLPMVLYHGTNASFDSFMPSKVGFYGAGVYLTSDPAAASGYAMFSESRGANVVPVHVAARRPYRYKARWDYLPSWYTEGWSQAQIDEALEVMSASPALIDAIFPREQARKLIDRVLEDANLGDEVPNRLQALGYDALVIDDRDAGAASGDEVIVFDPTRIKSVFNRGSFDGSSPNILFQRVTRSFKLRPFGRGGQAVEVVQDRYNRWKQAIEDVKAQGGTVTEASDFYRAEERYWGQVGSRIDAFEAELSDFVKAVAKDGLTLDDVALYAYAQHAEERNEYIASINPQLPDGGSGMTTQEADEILAEAQASGLEPELQRHAATLRRWIAGTRDVLRDGGLISDEEFDAWSNAYTHYVPLRGLDGVAGNMATGKGYNIRGDEGQQAHGRRSQAKHIIEHIVQDRVRSLVRVGKNEVLRSFARFVMDNPSPNLWEVNAVERRPAVVVGENGDREVVDRETVIADERTVTLKDGGEEIHILVKDERLLAQLRHHGVEQDPAWPVASLLWANRLLSRLYTSLSPVFTVVNFLRDAQTATFGVIDEIGFLAAPKLLAKLPGALVESFAAEAGRKSGEYQLFEALGGKTSFHALRTIDDQAAELQRLLRHEQRSGLDPRNAIPAAFKLIEAINGGIENATRLAAFKVAREAGRSTAESASIAKNITVNFNRRGTQQLASAWFLFFNPAVQGTARIIQSLAHPKVQVTIGMAMVGVAALALRNVGMGEDDDGVAWWDKIPEEVKERNLVIILPPGATSGDPVPKSKTGRYIKIPMPYGYNFFAVVANQVVDAWRHAQDPRRGRDLLQGAVKAFNAFMGSWLPVEDVGRALSPETGEGAGKSAVLALVPDALDPLAQIGLNWSGFGRKLYPDDWTTRNMPDASRYFSGQAGTIFQRGAQALNESTGGNRFASGWIDMTPASLETLARAYGGGPVSFALDLTNAVYARQSIERPDLDAKRLPFFKQAWGTIDAETDRLTGYQRLEAAERITGPFERAMRQGARDVVRQMRDEHGPMLGLAGAVETTRERLSLVRKAELKVIEDTTMPDSVRYAQLQVLAEKRRLALQQFNVAYDKAVLAAEARKKERTER